MTSNPLLAPLDPPAYADIRLEHLTAGIDQIILDNHNALARIILAQRGLPTWDDLVMAIDALDARLNNAVRLIVPLYTRGEAWKAAVDEAGSRPRPIIRQSCRTPRCWRSISVWPTAPTVRCSVTNAGCRCSSRSRPFA